MTNDELDKAIDTAAKHSGVAYGNEPCGKRIAELERKLAVAREFILDTQSDYKEGSIGYIDCEKALAQIGGDDAG